MRWLGAVAGLVLLVALGGVAPTTLAQFTAARTMSANWATGSLAAPTALAGTGGTAASLTWTASTSTAATGYQVLRSTTSGTGYVQVGTVTPVSATTAGDSPGPGTWYYVLRTYLQGWTSGPSNQATVVVAGTVSTGLKGCTQNAADTGGHGDGYETTPGNGCAPDTAVAVDASTGMNTTVSCTDGGKDRHRFWGYPFGLPGPGSAIGGISVSLVAGQNNNSGTTILCVELSPDGGTTWTAPRQVTLTGPGLTSYALGGTGDTWGRAWTAAQLDPSVFRVRVTDATSRTGKDIRLDYVGVGVTYQP